MILTSRFTHQGKNIKTLGPTYKAQHITCTQQQLMMPDVQTNLLSMLNTFKLRKSYHTQSWFKVIQKDKKFLRNRR